MKLNTTKALIATVLATAFAGVSVTAFAQNSTPPVAPQVQPDARATPMDPARMVERQQAMQARMSERHARHMERLKAELKLSPEQEAAWKAFVVRTEPQPFKAPGVAQDAGEHCAQTLQQRAGVRRRQGIAAAGAVEQHQA